MNNHQHQFWRDRNPAGCMTCGKTQAELAKDQIDQEKYAYAAEVVKSVAGMLKRASDRSDMLTNLFALYPELRPLLTPEDKSNITMDSRYTKEDKICVFCGGNITGHCCAGKIMYWCKKCGANNRITPPSVTLKFSYPQSNKPTTE